MEEENMEVEQVFVAYEIDLDYEFDAARFFDFCRQETPAEARQEELWFETAGSYPPSPFVSKLIVRDDIVLGNTCSRVSAEIKFTGEVMDNNGSKEADGNISSGLLGGNPQSKQSSQVTAGLTFCSKTFSGSLNSKAKAAIPKSSTLMKSTASQLAKQNRPPHFVGSRFQKLLSQNNERTLPLPCGVENQASKRQKLEGGVLRKVAVADIKLQTNFVYKEPKKDSTIEQNSAHAKLKLTIPREPDLETAHRAQRMRPRNTAEAERMTVAVHRFKARPLNKKILDAPSLPPPKRSAPRLPEFQEFHLKTSERATQHSLASSSSSLHCNDFDKGLGKHSATSAPENRIRDSRRPSSMSAPKHDILNFARNFKARPLNKKIFSSKGDIGVFLNSKQETTVPMEFKLHTEKKVQHSPPIEFFSKLSLATELQPNNGPQLKPPGHAGIFRDSKENISSSFHPQRKEKSSILGGKQTQCGSNDCVGEAGSLLSTRGGAWAFADDKQRAMYFMGT